MCFNSQDMRLLIATMWLLLLVGCQADDREDQEQLDADLRTVQPVGTSESDGLGGVDTTFVSYANLTRAEEDERIVIRITGVSWDEPFEWTAHVVAGTDTLYSLHRDDSSWDEHFGEDGLLPRCHDYLDCKRRWYRQEIVPFVNVDVVDVTDDRREMFNQTMSAVAAEYLVRRDFSSSEVDRLVEDLRLHYEERPLTAIYFVYDPGVTSGLLVYHPTYNRLMPIYR